MFFRKLHDKLSDMKTFVNTEVRHLRSNVSELHDKLEHEKNYVNGKINAVEGVIHSRVEKLEKEVANFKQSFNSTEKFARDRVNELEDEVEGLPLLTSDELAKVRRILHEKAQGKFQTLEKEVVAKVDKEAK